MLGALATLVTFQIAGETVRHVTSAPVPGPVLGMGLLLMWLCVRGGPSDALAETGRTLLGHLPLLFVPAAVGVVAHVELLRHQWPAMLIAVVGGTVITIALTGLITSFAAHWAVRQPAAHPSAETREAAE